MAATIVRWIARVGSISSLALLLAFAAGSGGGSIPTAAEAVALGLFPVGVVVGFLIAWRREGPGGAITVLSLAGFYLWLFLVDGRLPRGPYFLLFASPGFLFLASWFLERSQPVRAGGKPT
jgi:hypothetical protein